MGDVFEIYILKLTISERGFATPVGRNEHEVCFFYLIFFVVRFVVRHGIGTREGRGSEEV